MRKIRETETELCFEWQLRDPLLKYYWQTKTMNSKCLSPTIVHNSSNTRWHIEWKPYGVSNDRDNTNTIPTFYSQTGATLSTLDENYNNNYNNSSHSYLHNNQSKLYLHLANKAINISEITVTYKCKCLELLPNKNSNHKRAFVKQNKVFKVCEGIGFRKGDHLNVHELQGYHTLTFKWTIIFHKISYYNREPLLFPNENNNNNSTDKNNNVNSQLNSQKHHNTHGNTTHGNTPKITLDNNELHIKIALHNQEWIVPINEKKDSNSNNVMSSKLYSVKITLFAKKKIKK